MFLGVPWTWPGSGGAIGFQHKLTPPFGYSLRPSVLEYRPNYGVFANETAIILNFIWKIGNFWDFIWENPIIFDFANEIGILGF